MRLAFRQAMLLGTFAISMAMADDLPAIQALPCETVCANSTGPVAREHPLPTYPKELYDASTYVEGFVMLSFTIKVDGSVDDIKTVSVVGPQKLAAVTIGSVKNWTYTPATLDGEPVPTNRVMVMTFRENYMVIPGARPSTVRGFDITREMIRAGKMDEAYGKLLEIQSEPALNLYERGMLANLQTLIALRKADYLEAHRLSAQAIEFSGDTLPPAVLGSLWESRIKSALALGDIADAVLSMEKFKKSKGFDPASTIVKYFDDTRAKADAMSVFGTTAKIPAADQADGFRLQLYRRVFAFQVTAGALDRFTLSCKQRAIESKITPSAEWHVPKNWSDCALIVYGDPGTTFRVVQASQ